MKIHFGLALDGERARQPANRLGEPLLGPLGFLDLLEGMLGLQTRPVAAAVRIAQYRDCLDRANILPRFYSQSYQTDPLGTAATLLSWRDQWHLHGWSRRFDEGDSPRLRDLDVVESLASVNVEPGIGERLKQLASKIADKSLPISQVIVYDAAEDLPVGWRNVLQYLPVTYTPALIPATDTTLLDKLQNSLLDSLSGGMPAAIPWRQDDSIRVVRAETRLTAARWLANRAPDGNTLIVAQTDAALLDRSFESAGVPLIGLKEHSAARPALQLLPLALAMIWQPVDVPALVAFLSHPVCPLPGYARRKLAAKLAGEPGIGGLHWQSTLDKIAEHYGEKAAEVLDNIGFWIECERFDPAQGAPLNDISSRIARLAGFFQTRLRVAESIDALSAKAAHAQCLDVLASLDKQTSGNRLTPVQLSKLLGQATARGSHNPLLYPEAGACLAIDDPAAAIAPVNEVVWWQLAMPSLPSNPPWSSAELRQLAAAGIALPAMDTQLDKLASHWLRPILATRQRLTLVLPPEGSEVHPLWQMITSLVKDIPIASIERSLADSALSTIQPSPLPARRRWWHLAPDSISHREKESHSSISILLDNPYQWVLRYPAALKLSQTLDVADGPRLYGLLAHRTVERFFTETAWQTLADHDIENWLETTFPIIVDEEGAVLRLPGRRADLSRCHFHIRRALLALMQQCRAAGIVEVASEAELSGDFAGGKIGGSADLILTSQDGRQAIVDMKWSGENRYPDKLKKNTHLQLAIYAELQRQKNQAWPAVGYFILNTARLFTHDAHLLTGAVAVADKTGNQTASLWQQFNATWRWRDAQLQQGAIEVVMPDTASDEASERTDDCIPANKKQESENTVYNDFTALAGWEVGR